MESLEVERIGNEKGHMIPYVNIIADLTEMQEDLREHFESQCDSKDEEINLIISQRDGGKYMSEVQPEQLGLHQHHLLPNVSIYQNGFTGNLILAGDMGIDEQLIDNEYPVFHIHETNWKRMLNAREAGNEDLLSKLIGEKMNIDKISKYN